MDAGTDNAGLVRFLEVVMVLVILGLIVGYAVIDV